MRVQKKERTQIANKMKNNRITRHHNIVLVELSFYIFLLQCVKHAHFSAQKLKILQRFDRNHGLRHRGMNSNISQMCITATLVIAEYSQLKHECSYVSLKHE